MFIRKVQDSLSLLEGDDQQLHLSNLTIEDGGLYSCYVSNQFDEVVSTGHVKVTRKQEQEKEQLLDNEGKEVWWPPTWWILVIIGVFIILILVVAVMCTKYRRERREKVEAVENAQCVARWTKKIFIERNFAVGGDESAGVLSPTIRIEKVLTSHTQWLSQEEEQDLYEFQLDEKWEFPREFLQLKEEIGAGAFGRVFKGLAHHAVIRPGSGATSALVRSSSRGSFTTVAVKMTKDQRSEQEVLDLVREIEIMKAVGGHENIVNLLGACTQPAGQPLMAILEFAEHGNLRDFLRAGRGLIRSSTDQLEAKQVEPVTTKEMIRFAYQVNSRMIDLLSLTQVCSEGCSRYGVLGPAEVCPQRSGRQERSGGAGQDCQGGGLRPGEGRGADRLLQEGH